MPLAGLLAALMAALPASAAFKYTKSCDDVDWLHGTVQTVQTLVEERLVEINPKLAEQVAKRMDRGVIFHCVNRRLAGGMAGTLAEKGKVPVILVMKKPERQREDWPYTIFHELLHASDPDNALMVTQELHNRGSFPDAVYGCTYAVRRRIDEGWTRLQTFVYDNWSLADQGIPMVETRCDNCNRTWDQRQMNKFGWLCANNGPFMTDEMRQRIPQLEQTYCLINGARDKCSDKICADYTEAFSKAGSAPTLRENFALSEKVNDFLFVSEAFSQQLQGATAEGTAAAINSRQSGLMTSLKAAGVLGRCAGDPNSFD